jgi:anthranilate synthase component 2
MILIIDNYDSFVYNIYQILKSIYRGEVKVMRNDEASPTYVYKQDPEAIIISPGPGNPEKIEDVGYSRAVVEEFYREKPILGICLGHQVIGLAMGAKIRKARSILHGKVSLVKHFGGPLYREIPWVFRAMRYHSYVIYNPPESLVVDAISLDDGEIMGIHHRTYPLVGVQYHPESVGTDLGRKILKAFVDLVRR